MTVPLLHYKTTPFVLQKGSFCREMWSFWHSADCTFATQIIVFVCISAISVLHAQNSRISSQRLRCSFNWQFWAVRNANIVHEAVLRLWWKRSIRRLIQDINKAGWKPNKHIAQGNPLGRRINNNTTPYKGKSINCQCFCPFRACYLQHSIQQRLP